MDVREVDAQSRLVRPPTLKTERNIHQIKIPHLNIHFVHPPRGNGWNNVEGSGRGETQALDPPCTRTKQNKIASLGVHLIDLCVNDDIAT